MNSLKDIFKKKITTKTNYHNNKENNPINQNRNRLIQKIDKKGLRIISFNKPFLVQKAFINTNQLTIIYKQIVNSKCHNSINNHYPNLKMVHNINNLLLLIRQLILTCLICTKLLQKYPAKMLCKKAVHLSLIRLISQWMIFWTKLIQLNTLHSAEEKIFCLEIYVIIWLWNLLKKNKRPIFKRSLTLRIKSSCIG